MSIPVMIVPILVRPEMLYAMLATIDCPVERLVIIDNGRCVDPDAVARATSAESHVVTLPANLGVSGSWNLGIKATPFAPWWLIANFDIEWPSGSLERLAAASATDRVALTDSLQPWSAFTIGEQVVEGVGLFDEALHPAYFEDDDYARRCEAAGFAVHRTDVEVVHHNSSTLSAGYHERNLHTFAANYSYYEAKRAANDLTEGGWSLARRRDQSWD